MRIIFYAESDDDWETSREWPAVPRVGESVRLRPYEREKDGWVLDLDCSWVVTAVSWSDQCGGNPLEPVGTCDAFVMLADEAESSLG